MNNNQRTLLQQQNHNAHINNQTGSPRWWRFRRSRVSGSPAPQQQQANQESWVLTVEHICTQLPAHLTNISASTRNSIIGIILLVLAWKFIIWTFELLITGLCLGVAVMMLLWFFRPDACWVITQVVLPYSEVFRTNVDYLFFQISNSFNQNRQSTPALPAVPLPRPRSPRTTIDRIYPEAPALEVNA